MINHTPKQNFLTWQKAHAEALQQNREQGWLTVSFAYALAEMANLGATTEQMNGARNFVRVFQNLWDQGETYKRLPVSRLETYDAADVTELLERAKTATEEKKK